MGDVMPKETINTPVGPYHVKIGWFPQGGVQVGVEAEGERSLFWQLLGYDTNVLQLLGTEIRKADLLDYEDDEQRARALLNTLDVVSNGGYRGIWSDLDRQGCNDVIRILRRARDSSFGRDE